MVSTIAPAPSSTRSHASAVESRFLRGRGFGLYLVLAALLAPVLKPTGLDQITILDGLNVLALMAFGIALYARRARIEVPLLAPVLIVAIGSLVAVTNASSYSRCAMTMIQDLYLYLWFIVLVNIIRPRDNAVGMRVAWMWAAVISALIGVTLQLTDGRTSFAQVFGAHGYRAIGLFDGPNSLADYLMMSLFVILSLSGQIRRLWIGVAMAVVLFGLVATKSSGAMTGWLAGMAVWAIVRGLTRTRSIALVAAVTLMTAAVGILGYWTMKESSFGVATMQQVQGLSYFARAERSAEGREQIWHRLMRRWAQTPFGIGPGNSSVQKVSVGERERKKSYRGKEAHNDYVGYLVERGPFGLLGFLLIIVECFIAVGGGLKQRADRAWERGAGGAIAAALAGGLVATAVHSLVMEKLHFRHYWLFVALVFAFRSGLVRPKTAITTEKSRHRAPRGAMRPAFAVPPSLAKCNGVHPESI